MDAMQSIAALVERTQNWSRERRQLRLSKGTPEAWRKTWQDAMREFYPECGLSWTVKEFSGLKNLVRRGVEANDVPAFLTWVVSNWNALRSSALSVIPGKPFGPAVPELLFIIKYVNRLHAAYQQTKPAIALAVPVHMRGVRPAAPLPVEPAPAPSAAPTRPYAPRKKLQIGNTPVVNVPHVDPRKSEQDRVRLGLKKWD